MRFFPSIILQTSSTTSCIHCTSLNHSDVSHMFWKKARNTNCLILTSLDPSYFQRLCPRTHKIVRASYQNNENLSSPAYRAKHHCWAAHSLVPTSHLSTSQHAIKLLKNFQNRQKQRAARMKRTLFKNHKRFTSSNTPTVFSAQHCTPSVARETV